jgi:hypothetical protein
VALASADRGLAVASAGAAVRTAALPGPAAPCEAVELAAPEMTEEELYGLARALDIAPPTPDPTLSAAVDAARSELAGATRVRRRAVGLIGLGCLILVVAAAILATGRPGVGGLVALLGPIAAIGGLLVARRATARASAVRTRLGGAELRRATADAELVAARARFDAAVGRAQEYGLAPDPAGLREQAQRRAERRAVRLRDERWRLDAGERLLAAGRAVGVEASTSDGALAALLAWQREQAAAASARESYGLRRQHLLTLLRGASVTELDERASHLEDRARAAAGPTGDHRETSIVDGDEAVDLDTLRASESAAAQVAHAAEVALSQWLSGVEPVGEAEEALARAVAELDRVRDLGETLDITRRLLAQAEQTAHRTIAPRLAEAVRAWLPETTAGRYTEVSVDPEKLAVRVRGPAGRWRDAERLSYGTAEQIYLMLRIALAEQLARPGVRCPLLLDDVTVHADPRRTAALLDLLRRASADRQIILFTQQDQVVAWAREHLHGADHAIIELPEVAVV